MRSVLHSSFETRNFAPPIRPTKKGVFPCAFSWWAPAPSADISAAVLQAGHDVTFLVRPRRAAELASAGLMIKSPIGDMTLNNPPTVQADELKEKFDVVLLSCKAFDLDDAIKSFAPGRAANLDHPDAQRHAAPG